MKELITLSIRPPAPPVKERSYRYCVCSHYWMDHSLGKPEIYRGFKHWWRNVIGMAMEGPCRHCVCPSYDELGNFTDEEIAEIREQASKKLEEAIVNG